MTDLSALYDGLARYTGDPLGYVMWAFPWGEPNTELESKSGPEPWQRAKLEAIRDGLLTPNQAIREAAASGHGVGKSALVAWIIKWSLETFAHTKGVVTANTEVQLKTKTWAELGKWHRLSLTKDLFRLTATALFHPDHERTWRCDMVAWSERNTEAFAGLHNEGRRILLVFDEASAIPDIIWETAEGALTDADTQIIWCVFGNPTRSTGRFRDCFPPGGRFANYWHSVAVDSRSISFTNKAQIAQWIETYGDDSDFVRIRVKGQFPRTGDMEFFSAADVDAAMARIPVDDPIAPLALGVDVARFGKNNSVIWPRRGRDAMLEPRQVFHGLSTVELAQQVSKWSNRADGIFIDEGGVGGGVVDYVRHLHIHCFGIQFGGKPDSVGYAVGAEGERYANKRAEMYGALRAWMKTGSLPSDPEVRKQLLSITYSFNNRDQIILTSKEVMMRDGLDSPDDVDALALTFALPLAPKSLEELFGSTAESEYNPFSAERMAA